ncbi:hypothetical protein ACFOOK_20815 [Micromonospora krabiensis]|uniref:PknH-like extracellular domain-containing protein n=1 Tax=Micromonospora krabiensis TaxID=307121 RepID=A0A1C3N8T0_9ACTN|nr:hypothetical protein [Micromonospora krabiensis]SBV28990.1 hypothetical protein GA0070620_4549 [Micromonospora krabiensis]
MPDQLFTDMLRDTRDLTWAPTEQVRRRGRQRTRRTRIVAGLAGVVAVAVVAAGAVAFAGGPDPAPPIPPATGSPTPTPSPTPSTAPSATGSPTPTGSPSTEGTPSSPPKTSGRPTGGSTDRSIPAAAMLQLADLPAGFRNSGSDLDGDWTLESVTIYCAGRSPSITPGEVARRGATFDSPTSSMIERVTRHSGGNAATAMDRVRDLVTGCRPERAGDSLSIVATGLAGDESLMVASSISGHQSHWLFVRQGDLVAQVWLAEQPSPDEAKPYARKVANRLCAGTPSC